jgi:hypothetical protein
MDGTTNTLNATTSTSTGRTSGSRVGSLLLLLLVVGGLHLVLFKTLETVAPLGTGAIDTKLIVIESDRTIGPMMFEKRVLDRLVADAR